MSWRLCGSPELTQPASRSSRTTDILYVAQLTGGARKALRCSTERCGCWYHVDPPAPDPQNWPCLLQRPEPVRETGERDQSTSHTVIFATRESEDEFVPPSPFVCQRFVLKRREQISTFQVSTAQILDCFCRPKDAGHCVMLKAES